jgi:hypothetical protein
MYPTLCILFDVISFLMVLFSHVSYISSTTRYSKNSVSFYEDLTQSIEFEEQKTYINTKHFNAAIVIFSNYFYTLA